VKSTLALALTAVAGLVVAAPGALADGKPVEEEYAATAPTPDPTNYAGAATGEGYSVCAQNVPGSFQVDQFKAPSAGKLKVDLTGFAGDWDLLLIDDKGAELAAGGSSDVSNGETAGVTLKKPATIQIVACNWAGGPTATVKYVFTPK
jgi:hypothetical protein